MEIKDADLYPKYSFRLSRADKEWLERELAALKAKFNAAGDGTSPVVTKNVLLMSALKRGLRFLRENVNARCIQKNLALKAEPSRVWRSLTDSDALADWWQPGMTLEPRVGGRFADGSDRQATGVVTAIAPNEFIQFTWKARTWTETQETVCLFHLRAGDQCGTRLELVHSGWENFPEPQAAALKAEFDARWDVRLGQLERHCSSTSDCTTPLSRRRLGP